MANRRHPRRPSGPPPRTVRGTPGTVAARPRGRAGRRCTRPGARPGPPGAPRGDRLRRQVGRAARPRPEAFAGARLVPAPGDGRVRRLRRPVRGHAQRGGRAGVVPRGSRGALPAPDAAADTDGPHPTTAATPSRTTAASVPTSARSTTCDGSPGCCAIAGSASASTWCSTTWRGSTSGRARRGATRPTATTSWSSPTAAAPDAYERTLPEVFPDFAPGSFTWDDDLAGWVWTTFNDYQWDLNWANPDVLCEYADIILTLANDGVEVFRLDAIAFTWKRLGTNCQNQPEVHALTQAHAHRDPDRLPGHAVQGRGDRRPAGPAGLPRAGRALGQGQRPRLPQRADGPRSGRCLPAATPGSPRTHCSSWKRRRARPHG